MIKYDLSLPGNSYNQLRSILLQAEEYILVDIILEI